MLSARAAHWAWVLRRWRAAVADALQRPFTFRHRMLGRFVYHPHDDLSRQILLYDFEQQELEFAMRHSAAGGTVIDVGANVGVFTVACARSAGLTGRVIALEPSAVSFVKLRRTCERLRLKNVELLQFAAGRGNARGSFVIGGIHEQRQHLVDERPTTSQQTVTVEVRRLDDIVGDQAGSVSVMKIDVEGHEMAVLAGAERILRNGRVALVVECYPAALRAAGTSADALWALLTRTHRCEAVVQRDGSVVPAARLSLVPPGEDETVNTLWVSRGADPYDARAAH